MGQRPHPIKRGDHLQQGNDPIIPEQCMDQAELADLPRPDLPQQEQHQGDIQQVQSRKLVLQLNRAYL